MQRNHLEKTRKQSRRRRNKRGNPNGKQQLEKTKKKKRKHGYLLLGVLSRCFLLGFVTVVFGFGFIEVFCLFSGFSRFAVFMMGLLLFSGLLFGCLLSRRIGRNYQLVGLSLLDSMYFSIDMSNQFTIKLESIPLKHPIKCKKSIYTK